VPADNLAEGVFVTRDVPGEKLLIGLIVVDGDAGLRVLLGRVGKVGKVSRMVGRGRPQPRNVASAIPSR
jgi:hypothetical protein